MVTWTTKMLSGLTSRWMKPSWCMCFSPPLMSRSRSRTTSSSTAARWSIHCRKDRLHSSIWMYSHDTRTGPTVPPSVTESSHVPSSSSSSSSSSAPPSSTASSRHVP